MHHIFIDKYPFIRFYAIHFIQGLDFDLTSLNKHELQIFMPMHDLTTPIVSMKGIIPYVYYPKGKVRILLVINNIYILLYGFIRYHRVLCMYFHCIITLDHTLYSYIGEHYRHSQINCLLVIRQSRLPFSFLYACYYHTFTFLDDILPLYDVISLVYLINHVIKSQYKEYYYDIFHTILYTLYV